MEHTHATAVQILNDANLCSEASQKVEYIAQLAELLVRKEPALLPQFVPDMGALQVDPSALVRKTYVCFLAQAVETTAGASLLQQAAGTVTSLLRDESPLVIKAALMACGTVLKAALGFLGEQPNSPEAKASWEAAKAMQTTASSLLQAPTTKEHFKLTAAKLVEGAVLLLSADHAPPPPGTPAQAPSRRAPQPGEVAHEATAQLRMLLDLLRPEAAKVKGKGPLVIAAIKAISVIANSRPRLLGPILIALLALAKEGGYHVSEDPGIGPDTPGTEISVGNALKGALCGVLRSRHSTSVPWRDRLVEALGAMGAGVAAEAALKYVARLDYKDAKSKQHHKPPESPTPDAKRARLSGSFQPAPIFHHPQHNNPQHHPAANPHPHPHPAYAPAPASQRLDPRRSSTPTPPPEGDPHMYGAPQQSLLHPHPPNITLHPPLAAPAGQLYYHPQPPPHFPVLAQQSLQSLMPVLNLPLQPAAPAAAAPLPAQPTLTSQSDLMAVHMMLPGLLAHPDPSLVPAFLDSLCAGAPALLADLVMALMLTSPLPPLEEVTERMERERAAEAAAEAAAEPQQVAAAQGPPQAGEGSRAPAPAAAAGNAVAVAKTEGPRGAVAAASAGLELSGAHGLPTMASMAAYLGRAVGSGGSSRHLPPGVPALPKDDPPSSSAPQMAQPAAPPPALATALAANAPLVPPPPLSAAGMQMLRTAAVRRVAASAATLPPHARQLWLALLARLAAAGSVATAAPAAASTATEEQAAALQTAQQAADTLHEDLLAAAAEEAAEGHGLELALNWLSALLAQQLQTAGRLRQLAAAAGARARAAADEGYQETQHVNGDGGDGGEEEEKSKQDVKEAKPDVKVLLLKKQEQEQGAMEAEQQPQQEQQQQHDADMQPAEAAGSAGKQVAVSGAAGTMEVDGPQGGGEGGVAALDLSGTRYESALLSLLERFRDGGYWSSLRSLFSECPALTIPGCVEFLEHLVASGGEGASAALHAAREAILSRPALRDDLMQLALRAAHDVDPLTRSKAVRLCCNQLAVVLGGSLAPAIIRAASHNLHALLGPPPPDPKDPDNAPPTEWSMEEASRYCELYATLCVRHHELLPVLMRVFASSGPLVKGAIRGCSEALAKALGHSNPQLVQLVREPLPGSEALVWHMLEVLMSCLLPSEAMLVACRTRYEATGDVSSLVPVVAALSKLEVLALLPKLLQVAGINLKSLYRKLATHNGALGDPLFSPAELLVALHFIDPRTDNVPPKALMAAVDAALHAPDVFPQQAVAQAIQQMEAYPALPLLFMRTVITALKAAPKLRKFIAELMARLISRQIWLDPGQWRGFLLLVEHTGRPYFHLMLQLPAEVLQRVLGLAAGGPAPGERLLDHDKAVQLAVWATSADNKTQVVRPVAALLEKVLQAHQAQQEAVDKAAADAAAALAAAVAGTAVVGGPSATAGTGAAAGTEGGEAAGGAAAAGPAGEKDGEEEETEEAEGGVGAGEEGRGGGGEGGEGGGEGGEGEEVEGEGGSNKREVDEFDLDFEALEEEEASEAGEGRDGGKGRVDDDLMQLAEGSPAEGAEEGGGGGAL